MLMLLLCILFLVSCSVAGGFILACLFPFPEYAKEEMVKRFYYSLLVSTVLLILLLLTKAGGL